MQVESSTVVDALYPGRSYSFAVKALNALGEGALSEPSQPVQTKISAPSQPFNPRPAPHGVGATSIALTWGYPRNDGGRQISKCALPKIAADSGGENGNRRGCAPSRPPGSAAGTRYK